MNILNFRGEENASKSGSSRVISLVTEDKRPSQIIGLLIAFLLVFDQIITYGLANYFGRGGGLGVVAIIFTSAWCFKLKFSTPSTLLIGALAPLMLLQIVLAAPLGSQLYVTFIIFSIFCLYLAKFKFYLSGSFYFVIALIVIAFFNIIAKFGFNVFGYVGDIESNRATGLYAEPSHMVYYVTVTYLFAIREQPRWKKFLGSFSAVILLANFSLSSIVPLLVIIWTALIGERKQGRKTKVILVLLFSCICIAILLATNLEYFQERNLFAEEGEQSATVQVIIYYYSMLIDIFSSSFLIGYGPDQFYAAYTAFSDATFPMFGDLNSTDGSFLLVKIFAEFGGVVSIMFVLIVFKVLKQHSVPAVFIFLQYVFFRGIGLTSIIPLVLLFLALSSQQKIDQTGRNVI